MYNWVLVFFCCVVVTVIIINSNHHYHPIGVISLEDAIGDDAVLLTTTFNHGNDVFGWNVYLFETDSAAVD